MPLSLVNCLLLSAFAVHLCHSMAAVLPQKAYGEGQGGRAATAHRSKRQFEPVFFGNSLGGNFPPFSDFVFPNDMENQQFDTPFPQTSNELIFRSDKGRPGFRSPSTRPFDNFANGNRLNGNNNNNNFNPNSNQTPRPSQAPFVFINNRPTIATMAPLMAATTPTPQFQRCFNNCATTSEYNPICGSNRQLYFNEQKFNCALSCGANIQILRRGSCQGLFPMMRG